MKRLTFRLGPKQIFFLFGELAGLHNGLHSQHVGNPHDHFCPVEGFGKKVYGPECQ